MRVLVMFMPTAKVVCAVLACLLTGIGTTFITAWVADHGQPLYFPTTGVLEGYNGDWPHPLQRGNGPMPGLGGPLGNGEVRPTHLSRAHEWNRDRLLYTASDPNVSVLQAVTGFGEGMDCVLTGVPFRALTRWNRMQDGGPFPSESKVSSGAFRVGRFGGAWGRWGGWTLPAHPIWPGFAYNVAIYSVVAWGLGWVMWQLPRAVWRRRRRSKGLCVRCGYDLKGLAMDGERGVPGGIRVCPECGGSGRE